MKATNNTYIGNAIRIFPLEPVGNCRWIMFSCGWTTEEFDFWHPTMQAMRLYKSNETAVHAEIIPSATAWKPPMLFPTLHSLAILDVKLHLEFLDFRARGERRLF